MANRFPLVFDPTRATGLQELPSGDNLNLAGSSIVDVVNVTASGSITASTLTVTNINIQGSGGGSIGAVALSNDYNDLDNKPILFSGSYNDLSDLPVGTDWNDVFNKPVIPTALSQLINDVGFANEESLNISADQITGLATVSLTNSYKDLLDASEIVTQSQLIGDTLTVEVTNTGDLVGSVFGADSSLLVDHLNNKVISDIETNSIISNTAELVITTPSAFPVENINIQLAQTGTIKIQGESINLVGTVTANDLNGTFRGTVYSDDSTIVVNGATGDLNGMLTGLLNGDIEKRDGTPLSIGSFAGIEIVPGGEFRMPNSGTVYIASQEDIGLFCTADFTIGSSSGVVKFDAGTTVDFANSTVNNFPAAYTKAEVDNLISTVTQEHFKFNITGDDSTVRSVTSGSTIQIAGGTAITTSSDADGNIIIAGVAQDFSWASITGTPTTIAGYGITDAFDGAFSSLSGTPTTIAGYGITDAFDGAFSSLSGTPTTIAGYGITDAFDGQYSSLTGTPTTLAGYGITDAATSAQGALADSALQQGDTLVGDLKGSVFADDSTLLVDAVNGEIPGYVKIADLKTALQDGAGDYAAFKAWVLANL